MSHLIGIIVLVVMFGRSHTTSGQAAVPQTVVFDNETYVQAYQNGNGVSQGRVTEYIRKGESLDRWVKLINIQEFVNTADLKEYVMRFVMIHKQQYPQYPATVMNNKDGSVYSVSFISAGGSDGITEFASFQIGKRGGHVVSYMFAYRNYNLPHQGDNDSYLRTLKANQNHWLDLTAALKLIK